MSLIPYIEPPKKKTKTKKQRTAWVKKKTKQEQKAVANANTAPYKGFKGGVFAKWGKRTWKVTADYINTLDSATYKDQYDTDKKKREPSDATFTYPLYKDLMPNVDIAAEIRNWRKLIGKASYLYLGGTLFGTQKKYRLVGVEAKNVDTMRGEIVHCDMKLTFSEITKSKGRKNPKRKKKTTTKKKTTPKKKATKKKTGKK